MKQDGQVTRHQFEMELAAAVSAAHAQVVDRMARRAVDLGVITDVPELAKSVACAWSKEAGNAMRAAALLDG